MDDKTPSHESAGRPRVLREYEFYGGCIRVKISVKNTSSLAILDAAFELESDGKVLHYDRCEPPYTEKNGKIILGNLNPNTDRTIAFYFDPLICAKEGTDINCHVDFKYADGTPDTVYMKTLKIQMVCPIFWTEQDINIGRLKELIEELHFNDSKVYTIPKRVDITECLKICRNIIQKHDVRHIKTFKTTDDTTYECWYFGKTKVAKKDLVIKCAICKDTESIEIFVSGNDQKDIIGLLAEIGRNLTKEFETRGKVQPVFNIVVKNSMVKGSNLLSFCDLNGICGGNVVIEDSFLEGTNVATGMQEDKEKARIEEQKKLEEAQKWEKEKQERRSRLKEQQVKAQRERKLQEEVDSREGGKARLEQERLKRHREEQDVLSREEQERTEKVELSASEKKEGFSHIRILAVALAFVLLVLGYWVLAPGGSDTSQPLQITPSPNATIIQTPKVTPTASPVSIVVQSLEQKTFTNSIGMEFVLIPSGEFDMGSPSNEAGRLENEGPVHHVKISNSFYMGKYEVSQKQWRNVMETSPSNFKGDDLPVEQVSWNDVQDFIKKLNEKESGGKYRLPTEAEWEFSARAGTTTRYSFGDDESILGDYAWYNANSDSKTHGGGQKKPNPWGLYDMHGNVWEWVQDIYHDSYSGSPTDGSSWESGVSSYRVLRGGGWYHAAKYARSASRGSDTPSGHINRRGFRLLKVS